MYCQLLVFKDSDPFMTSILVNIFVRQNTQFTLSVIKTHDVPEVEILEVIIRVFKIKLG